MRLSSFLQLFILNLICSASIAQNASISGTVRDYSKGAIPGINIILQELELGTATDSQGHFILNNIKPGSYLMVISGIGYEKQYQSVKISENQQLSLSITLDESLLSMQEVIIRGETAAGELKKAGFALDVVETRQFQNFTADINQVLQSTPGIQIREQGGLGSSFDLSLNGLSGNQIRYFINGIPMENFGSALTLNNFPVNLIDQIEIYKGVVPVSLAADALGGAINITTAYQQNSFLDATYSFGSFNTHRASLNGQSVNRDKGRYIKLSSFFNHSDNNYRMYDMPVYDLNLGNHVGTTDINRFHSQYTSGMIQLEAGLIEKKLADKLSLAFTQAQNKKHYQHPDNNIYRVFGHFHTRNNSLLASANYQKHHKGLDLTGYLMTGQIRESVVDTSNLKYNWAGEYIRREADKPNGELFERRSLLELTDLVFRSNLGIGYELNHQHQVELNLNQNCLKRTGIDRVNEFNRSFESPNFINKNILGFAYTYKSLREKWQATLFAKKYWYQGKIITTDYEDELIVTQPSFDNTGYGGVIAWEPNRKLQVKSSFEQTYRIPESFEILGDGIYILPNPNLQPERSYNGNASIKYETRFGDFHVKTESNYFYRNSLDFIRFNPLGPFGEFENLNKVRTTGLEGTVSLDYKDLILFNTNITWQKLTDQNRFDEGLPNTNYQSRIPNIPYLFGNARLGYNLNLPASENDITVYWNTRYIHDFFLTWENLGSVDNKHIIPAQLTHDLQLDYSFEQERYNISFSVNNLFNAIVFDNFNVQKPGRAMHIKLRYFISNQ